MTGKLVARKGAAEFLPRTASESGRDCSDSRSAPDPHRPRRLFVPLSHDEHERLSIAAAKTKSTPHQVVHAALDHYFRRLAADAQCQCIADVSTRGCAAN